MHNEIQKLLTKYHEGQCTDEECAAVKAHLKECDECKRVLMEMDFEISYNPYETEMDSETENTNQAEALQKNSAADSNSIKITLDKKRYNNSSLHNTATDEGQSSSERSEKIDGDDANINVKRNKNKVKNTLVKAVAVCVLVVVAYYGTSALMLRSTCENFITLYDESFIIPEECINSSGTVNKVELGQAKRNIYDKLSKYYTVENDNFEEMYDTIDYYLSQQADDEMDWITEPDEVTKVDIKKMSFSTAEVWVYMEYGDERYGYKINCIRKGLGWKIKNTDHLM